MAYIEHRGHASYRLVVDAGYGPDGKRIRRTKTIKIEDEALLRTTRKLKNYLNEELTKFKIEVESGEYIAPEKMTFASFVNEWREKYAEKSLAPLTLKTYQHHLQNHILPAFGHKRIDQIKPLHIVTFLNDLEKPGARKDGRGETLSSGTIEYIYRVLKNVLNRAVEWKVIPSHPMEGIKKPKVEYSKPDFYEENEVIQAIDALYKEPRMWRLFCLGAMIGGFRRGELLALQWQDVNFEENTITIDESISLTRKGEAVIKKPKTESSIRTVDMPTWYMRELKEWYREWVRGKLKVGDKWLGGDKQYVFHAGFGKPIYHSQPSHWWKKFVQRHGLRYIRLHDLRHTAATLLIEDGTPLKAIQERLGHSRQETTANIYTHVTKKLSKETAAKLEKFAPEYLATNLPPMIKINEKGTSDKSLKSLDIKEVRSRGLEPPRA